MCDHALELTSFFKEEAELEANAVSGNATAPEHRQSSQESHEQQDVYVFQITDMAARPQTRVVAVYRTLADALECASEGYSDLEWLDEDGTVADESTAEWRSAEVEDGYWYTVRKLPLT